MSVRRSLRTVGLVVTLAAAFSLVSCKSDNATRSPDLPPPKLKAFTFTCTTTSNPPDTTEPHTIEVSQTTPGGLCTATCVYTVVNEDGEQVDQPGCIDFTCRSRDNDIATVTNVNKNPAQCDVRGVSPGNVNIVATVDGGIGSREFNVQAAQATGLTLNCTANETIPGGASRQYQATATFADNSTQNVTTQATWSVVPDNANPDFVDVNQSGLVTTRNVAANSPATVTAVFQNQSASCNFTVVPAQILRICVEPDTGAPDFFFGTTRAVTNNGDCVSPEVTLQLASTTGGNTRRYRARVVFNSNQESDATLQSVWSEVPDPTPVICVENDLNNDGDADAGDSDCTAANLTDGRVVATQVGGPVQVQAAFGNTTGAASVRVDAGGGNQVLARNSLLVGNPLDTDGNGVRGEATDIPGKFFCVGYADLVGGLTRVPELPGNKQMVAVIRTCTAPLPPDGNCVPCNVALDAAGNCPTPGGFSAPRATADEINDVQWAVPQDASFFDGNDCAATQTQASTGNIPAARVGNTTPFPSATNPADPELKGNVTAIGAVRLGTACVRGTITRGLAPNNFDSDGATALVLPVTNDVLFENANQDAVQLCNALVPLFELGLENGPGAVTQLVSVLSDILNPLLTAIAQDQTGGGPIPTDDLIDQLTAGLGALTEPLLQALEPLVEQIDSGVYAPVNCGLGTLLNALLSGDPGSIEAIQECAP